MAIEVQPPTYQFYQFVRRSLSIGETSYEVVTSDNARTGTQRPLIRPILRAQRRSDERGEGGAATAMPPEMAINSRWFRD